ncbi:hypothetical protein AAC387_Pa08g2639 [Persea americana]
MSNHIVINECSYLSGCARTSQRKVTAHSTFSVSTGTRNGLAALGTVLSWHSRRAAELISCAGTPNRAAELTPLCWHSQPSCRAGWWRSLESALLTEPPNCWAVITEAEVDS